MVGGLSAIAVDFGPHSPLRSVLASSSTRLLLTGIIFAGTGSLVAISPLGRLSGAHLNPVLTLVFWATGHVHGRDLFGYIGGQFAGAVGGAAAASALWGAELAGAGGGVTRPGPGVPPGGAAAGEAVITAVLILTILAMLSNRRTMRLTPLVLWVLIALLVWLVAPYTGTSMNPARSFGPALVFRDLGGYWIYVAGPLAGGVIALGVQRAFSRWIWPLEARLFHDPRHPTVLGTALRRA